MQWFFACEGAGVCGGGCGGWGCFLNEESVLLRMPVGFIFREMRKALPGSESHRGVLHRGEYYFAVSRHCVAGNEVRVAGTESSCSTQSSLCRLKGNVGPGFGIDSCSLCCLATRQAHLR